MDPVAADRNLQQIRTIEGSWSLPGLPDEVKLDLASQSSWTGETLASFLFGLQTDVNEANRPPTVPLAVPQRDNDGMTGLDVGRYLYGIFDVGSPTRLDPYAPIRLKQRAVDLGYLDLTAEQVNDPSWNSGFNTVARQMQMDRLTEQFHGNKPGSMDIGGGVSNVIEDWLSPRGLMKAAVGLDLLWDADAIGREVASWGDKVQEWAEQPWNPMRLYHAVTGPVDDLVFPVLNWYLMLTGVGEVVAVARGLRAIRIGTDALEGARAAAGLAKGAEGVEQAARTGVLRDWYQGVFKAADTTSDIARLQQPGLIAGRLERFGAGGDTLTRKAAAGWYKGIEQWRSFHSVATLRKANQQIMRLGFVGNVEQELDVHGTSLADVTSIDETIHTVLANPAVDWGVDLLFTPYTIFEPGSISRTVRSLTHLPGNSAVRAGLGKVWVKASDNQKMTAAFDGPTRRAMAARGPEAEKVFDEAVNTVGLKQALADTWTGGDVEQLGAMMAWLTIMGAVHTSARTIYHGGKTPLGMMTAAERGGFRHTVNRIAGQLRYVDPADIDGQLDRMARYGFFDDGTETVRKIKTRKGEYQALLVGQPGKVPAGLRKLYGWKDADTGEIRWVSDLRKARKNDPDPFITYIDPVELAEHQGVTADVAGQLIDQGDLPQIFWRRYMDSNRQMYRYSQKGQIAAYLPDRTANLRQLVDGTNGARSANLGQMLAQMNPQTLETYLDETLDSWGNWGLYESSMDEMRIAFEQGDIDAAAIAAPFKFDELGRKHRLGVGAGFERGNYDSATEMMLDLFAAGVGDKEYGARIARSAFGPLLRDLSDSVGRPTLARLDTPLKQQYETFYAVVRGKLQTIKDLRALKRSPNWDQIRKRAGKPTLTVQGVLGDEGQVVIDKADVKQLRALGNMIAGEVGLSVKRRRQLNRLLAYAARHDLDLDAVEESLMADLAKLDASADWSTKYRVPTHLGFDADLEKRIGQKLRELKAQTQYVAAAIDNIPDRLAARFAQDGYRLVWSQEAFTPADLKDLIPEFEDVTTRHLRRIHLDSLFTRPGVGALAATRTRAVRLGLYGALAGHGLNLGTVDNMGADLERVVDDVGDVMREVQEEAAAAFAAAGTKGPIAKVSTWVTHSLIPHSPEQLPSIPRKDFFLRFKQRGYTEEQTAAIYRGLLKGQTLTYKELGLYNLEGRVRSSNLANGLRYFGTTDVADGITDAQKMRIRATTLAGAVGGAVYGNYVAGQDPDVTPGQQAITAGAGALLGLAGTRAYGMHAGLLTPTKAVAGASSFSKFLRPFNKGIPTLADTLDSNSRWIKYAHLGDAVVTLRDRWRFSLSPIFDLSRYAEAITLNQIADLPPGVHIPLNSSPKAFRRMVAKQGGNPESTWNEMVARMTAAGRGETDWEVMDAAGRRFQSIGVLGFSTSDWMTSTFAHLVRQGVDDQTAYDTVRSLFTYVKHGTTRSAAELSMNFVFFPFSFTKKTLGHMGDFLRDDLGRTVLLHDMLKTYELLNENYDLNQMWKDRLPILNRMSRLNLLSQGISLGEFGGVNAPILQAIGDIPNVGALAHPLSMDGIVNVFAPQIVAMRNQTDVDNLMDDLKRIIPVWNDIPHLVEDLAAQGRVITSRSHMTAEAEARRGWEEWNEYRDGLGKALGAYGATWAQAMRNPLFAQTVEQRRGDIAHRYPSWIQAYGDGIAHRAALDLELEERFAHPVVSDGDPELIEFTTQFRNLEAMMRQVGQTFTNPETVDPTIYTDLRKLAVRYAGRNPAFIRLYNRYYRRLLGDIVSDI